MYLCISLRDDTFVILYYDFVGHPNVDSNTTIGVDFRGDSCCGQATHLDAFSGITVVAKTKFSASSLLAQVWMDLSNQSEFTSFCHNLVLQYNPVNQPHGLVFRELQPSPRTSGLD